MVIKSSNTTQIVRVEKSNNFSVINNTCFRDKRLSFKAKGIMGYFLQLPDNWVINLNEIMTHSTDGEKSFRSGLDELKEFGYVQRKQIRQDNKIVGWETIIREIPLNVDNTLFADYVHVGNVEVQKVDVGNEGLLNTNITNNLDLLNTNNNKNNNTSNEVSVVQSKKGMPEEMIKLILSYFNEKMDKNFRYSKTTVKLLDNLYEADYKDIALYQFVIDNKYNQWINNNEMKVRLVPATLFALSNFEKYVDESEYIPSNNQYNNQAELKPWEVAAYGEEPSRTSYDDDRSIVQQQIKIEQPKFNI